MTDLMSKMSKYCIHVIFHVCRITYVPAEYIEEYRTCQQVKNDILSEDTSNTQQYVPHTHFHPFKDSFIKWTKQELRVCVCMFSQTVSELPEREDGEGEESELQTAALNSWNLPRR